MSLKVAVVGTSAWAKMAHLYPIRSHEAAELVGVCGREAARTEAVAAELGTRAFTSFDDMLREARPQALVVAAPNDVHATYAIRALEEGLHVLCEKPLARTLDEARAMLAAAERADRIHMVFLTYRGVPEMQRLGGWIDEGRFGRVHHVSVDYVSDFAWEGGGWRFDPEIGGAGVLADLGPHALDLVQWFGGSIERVCAAIHRRVREPVDRDIAWDTSELLLELRAGGTARCRLSAVDQLPGRVSEEVRVRITGSAGTAELRFWWDRTPELEATFDVGEAPLTNQTPEQAFLEASCQRSIGARAFVDAVRFGAPPRPSFRDGYEIQRLLADAEVGVVGAPRRTVS